MNTQHRSGRIELSAEGRRRKDEILGAVSVELGRVSRRRRVLRAGAAGGGLAACGLGALVALRVLAPSPTSPTPPIVVKDSPRPDVEVATAPVEPLAPDLTMASARFEVVRGGAVDSLASRLTDEELLTLAAEAGHLVSLIRVGGDGAAGNGGRTIVTDSRSGAPLGVPEADPAPGPSGERGEDGRQSPRRAV